MQNITENKINEYLSKMTVREKAGQLNQVMFEEKKLDELISRIRKGEIGSFIMAPGAFAGHDEFVMSEVDVLNEVQRVAVTESPNGIPIINGKDVIHGYRVGFPVPLACAASFNTELIEQSFEAAADEAAAEGVHWSFAPMLDISRDPRWGRIIESFGEDPYLSGKCAAAAVHGFEGDKPGNGKRIAACAKHYIGYGAAEGGRDYHKCEISDYTLRNIYLPSFAAAVKAGVSTVMSSFNEIGGRPVSSNRYLLTDILRGELGFKGFVISDWCAVKQLIDQRVAKDRKECCELSLYAGIDMDMVDEVYIDTIEELVENGTISMESLDEAVRRVLRVKFKAGLFENPYIEKRAVDFDKHMKLAAELAAESMILLKNDGVLPLDKSDNICIAGPMAADTVNILGGWTLSDGKDSVSVLEAMENIGENVHFVDSSFISNIQRECRYADAVVLVLGEASNTTGEARSLTDIELSDAQKELVMKARRFSKKLVGVICAGRPLAMQNIEPYFDALLYAWHGGSATGNAVSGILFGDICPSGKAPVTFPRVTGQIPIYYNVPSSGRYVNGYYGQEAEMRNYEDCSGSPMYPFGYGLSYTDFEYASIKVDKKQLTCSELKNGEKFRVSVMIRNSGNYDGKETAQCYIRDVISKMTRPIRELKGFKKVLIQSGETIDVCFELGFEELGYYCGNGMFDVEPGDFDIFVGGDCYASVNLSVTVTA